MAAALSGNSQCYKARQSAGRPYHIPTRATMERGAVPTAKRATQGTSKTEKSKNQAQQRRMTQKGLMDELAGLLPFPKEVTSQMDSKTVLRLALCYLRLKSLLSDSPSQGPEAIPYPSDRGTHAGGGELVARRRENSLTLPPDGTTGVLHDLTIEALQGFLLVMSCDGTILYLSDNVFTYIGIFQSEHTGSSLYSLVHEDDHSDVRDAVTAAEAAALTSGVAPCSFFCRMKSKKKNSHLKAPGYKLVYLSGHCKLHQQEPYVACAVHIVSVPSVLEIRMEGNSFTTRHSLDMKVTYYDGRLGNLLGYSKKDLIGLSMFSLHHHDDYAVTEACSRKVREKGESVTGYYRFLTRHGTFVWLQSRASMVVDRRTGKPSQVICMHFVVEKSTGDRSLTLRNMLTDNSSQTPRLSVDPIPVPRWDGETVNPLKQTDPLELSTSSPRQTSPASNITSTSSLMSVAKSGRQSCDAVTVSSSQQSCPTYLSGRTEQGNDTGCDEYFASQQGTAADPCPFEEFFSYPDNLGGPAITQPSLFPSTNSLSVVSESRQLHPLYDRSAPVMDASITPPSLCPLQPSRTPPLVVSENEQLFPFFDQDSLPISTLSSCPSSSIREQLSLTPFSNHSTPAPSPFLTTPSNLFSFPHSNSTSPRSIPGSNVTSPHSTPIPTQAFEPGPLDPLLLDMLGNEQFTDSSTSPDSGCSELENYLISLIGMSPSTSSPTGSSATPSPLSSNMAPSPAPSPLGGVAPSTAPTPRSCSNLLHPQDRSLNTAKNNSSNNSLIRNLLSTALPQKDSCYQNHNS